MRAVHDTETALAAFLLGYDRLLYALERRGLLTRDLRPWISRTLNNLSEIQRIQLRKMDVYRCLPAHGITQQNDEPLETVVHRTVESLKRRVLRAGDSAALLALHDLDQFYRRKKALLPPGGVRPPLPWLIPSADPMRGERKARSRV